MDKENDSEVSLGYVVSKVGQLKGHSGWVTKVVPSPTSPDYLVSASRDKTILVWKLSAQSDGVTGKPHHSFIGHNHFVSDCVVSKDGGFILSSSWDKTLRLWDINKGITKRHFKGHKNDVLSVGFSHDNRQIFSGSRDKTVRLWNTVAVEKHVFEENGHKDYVSSVCAIPVPGKPVIVSGGWDKLVKVWSLSPIGCAYTFHGHTNAVNSVTVSPDGALLASGGKDGNVLLWDYAKKAHIKTFNTQFDVSSVTFNPSQYLLAAATGPSISLFDLKTHEKCPTPVFEDFSDSKSKPQCTCLSWSMDGSFLYAGYTDNTIRIYQVTPKLH